MGPIENNAALAQKMAWGTGAKPLSEAMIAKVGYVNMRHPA